MNKKICALFLALALLLSGCQLAKPETETQTQRDKLVGVFVTEEYLDLFDMEAYLQDHIGDLANGSLTVEDSAQYSGRIYAEFVEDTADGFASGRYVFQDLEGILMASYRVMPHGNNENAYWSSDVTEGLCNVSTGHYSRDDGFDLEMSGTIYVSTSYIEPCFYFNPVYQTPEGDVYLTAGSVIGFATGFGSSAHTFSEEGTYTENGVENSYSSEIKVTLETVNPAKRIVVLQMDENNRLLRRDEFDPQQPMDSLVPVAGCAYVLVEEHTVQGVRRALYQTGDRHFTAYRVLENDICVQLQVPIQWDE